METKEQLGRQLKSIMGNIEGFSADVQNADIDGIADREREATRSGDMPQNMDNTPSVTVNIPEIKMPQQDINLSISLDGHELTRAVARAADEMNRQLNTRLIR